MSNKRLEYIKTRFTNISDENLDLIDSIDFTHNKLYLVWLARIYSNGEFIYKNNINENSINAAKQILKSFHENKNNLPENKRDINGFKSLFELSTFMFFIEKDKKIEQENFLKNGALKVFENNNWLVVQPFTMESAIKFGKDTKWCTAAKERNSNHFHSYYGKGELFIIINKNEKNRTINSKLQFYFRYKDCGGTLECRNSNNSSVDELEFFRKNKEILKAISVHESFSWRLETVPKYFSLLSNPSEEQILSAVKSDYKMLKYVEENKISETIQIAYLEHFLNKETNNFVYYFKELKNPTEKAKEIAIKIYPSIIKFLEEKCGGTSEELKIIALNEKPSVIKYIKEPSEKMIRIALETKPELIEKINNPTQKEQVSVVQKVPNLLRKIDNPYKETIIEALKNGTIKLFNDYKNKLSKSELEIVVKQNIKFFKFIEEPSEELQEIAIKDDFNNIKLIKNPSKKIKSLATRLKNKLEAEHKRFMEQNSIRNPNNYRDYNSWGDYLDYDKPFQKDAYDIVVEFLKKKYYNL